MNCIQHDQPRVTRSTLIVDSLGSYPRRPCFHRLVDPLFSLHRASASPQSWTVSRSLAKGIMFRILHIPPSDPPIPPVDQCLHCGKDDRPLKRCSQCKMAKFCDRSCQQKAWKAGHKKCCTELAARNQEHMLPYRVRVIRHRHGAYIENPQDIPAIQAPKTKEEKVLLQKKDVGTK